jgi:hypothetical protein
MLKLFRNSFPIRQGLRNLAMLPEWDRQDDVSASSASGSDLATTVGPMARASGASASGGRVTSTQLHSDEGR